MAKWIECLMEWYWQQIFPYFALIFSDMPQGLCRPFYILLLSVILDASVLLLVLACRIYSDILHTLWQCLWSALGKF